MIFFFFKPLALKKQTFVNVPQLELEHFKMYEFTPEGLQTFMTGENGIKYAEKFIVKDINYTDKTPEYKANMKAGEGVYEKDVVLLENNVTYSRDNGFDFHTPKLHYDKKNAIAISDAGYTANIGNNTIIGSYIKYNNKLNRVYSKNIDAIYQIQERK